MFQNQFDCLIRIEIVFKIQLIALLVFKLHVFQNQDVCLIKKSNRIAIIELQVFLTPVDCLNRIA